MQVDYRNISLEFANSMTDEDILRLELRNHVAKTNISKNDAEKLTDVEILALEGVVGKNSSFSPQGFKEEPISIPEGKYIHPDEDNEETPCDIPNGIFHFHSVSKPADHKAIDEISPQKHDEGAMKQPLLPDDVVAGLPDQEFFPNRLRGVSFLSCMEIRETRHKFTILVDSSIGMFNRGYSDNGQSVFDVRWAEAKELVGFLIPELTRFNDAGASLHFFSNKVVLNEFVQTADQSAALFDDKKRTQSIKGNQKIKYILLLFPFYSSITYRWCGYYQHTQNCVG